MYVNLQEAIVILVNEILALTSSYGQQSVDGKTLNNLLNLFILRTHTNNRYRHVSRRS